MGLYDRPYYQDEERNAWLSGRSMVVNLILINVGVYVLTILAGDAFARTISLHADLFTHPWQAWQLLTYGFVHDRDLGHILFNMIGLWVFGNELEGIYGRAEFTRFYVASLIFAGLVWAGFEVFAGQSDASLRGASGAVMALMILWVLHFPKRKLYVWGILPMPGWALGGLYIFFDLAYLGSADNVAHVAHLAGVAFGVLYQQAGLNLGRWVPSRLSWSSFRLRPKLRIHRPEEAHQDLTQRVDEILEKISREGEASLTKKERRTLEEASRRYQQRRD